MRVVIASFNAAQAEMAHAQVAAIGLPVEVHVGRTPELIRVAECCMACSGSVSLELLYHEKPTVVVYWVSRTAMRIQRFFRKSRYITLVNLLATSQLEARDGETYDPDRPGAERFRQRAGNVEGAGYLHVPRRHRRLAGGAGDELLGEGAGAGHAGEPEPFVDALTVAAAACLPPSAPPCPWPDSWNGFSCRNSS